MWSRLVDNVSKKLAFFPPVPSTYEVKSHSDDTRQLYIQPLIQSIPKVLTAEIKLLDTVKLGKGGCERIVTAFVPFKNAKLTLLYSHGNAVDLGQMLPVCRELSRLLGVNVMAYDYTGYGKSTGEPSVSHTLADIETVYRELTEVRGLPGRSIIAYGQSVGSGPTAYLASNKQAELGGVVFHSPLLSGLRVLAPGIKWWPSWADVYPNHLHAPKITAPVCVMHGTEDEVIHVSCGQRLHELCKNASAPLWATGFGHQNLEMCPEYLPHLTAFLKKVQAKAAEQQ